jgi:putative transposase
MLRIFSVLFFFLSNYQWPLGFNQKLQFKEGWVFLCIFLDLYTRKVVGFSMADNMKSELLINALTMALGRQTVDTENLLSHSDRGSQYAGQLFQSI